jgi:hypothetical protein
MTTAWGDRAVLDAAMAIHNSFAIHGQLPFVDDEYGPCADCIAAARAASLSLLHALKEPSEEMIAAGWSPSVHDEDLVNVLRAMVGRAEEEIRG